MRSSFSDRYRRTRACGGLSGGRTGDVRRRTEICATARWWSNGERETATRGAAPPRHAAPCRRSPDISERPRAARHRVAGRARFRGFPIQLVERVVSGFVCTRPRSPTGARSAGAYRIRARGFSVRKGGRAAILSVGQRPRRAASAGRAVAGRARADALCRLSCTWPCAEHRAPHVAGRRSLCPVRRTGDPEEQ